MYSFTAFGHQNILSTHKNTLEFTKDPEINIEADCITGVSADFDLDPIKELIEDSEKLRMTITADDITDELTFTINKDFSDDTEIVIRKTEFNSERTLGILSDKAAKDLKPELIEKMKVPGQSIRVVLEECS